MKSLVLSLVAWESDWDLNLDIVCGCGHEVVIEQSALAGMTEDGWWSYTCAACRKEYRIGLPFLLKQPHLSPDDDNYVTENRPDPQG